MKKSLISVFFAMLAMLTLVTPAFAATNVAENPSDDVPPGLVSERVEYDDEGNAIIIQVYKLTEDGEMPVPQTRASTRTLFNGWASLKTFGGTGLADTTGQSTFRESIDCYNYGNSDGAGAVTFTVVIPHGNASQAVDAGYGVQFHVEGKIKYSVSARANWWDGSYKLKVTAT